MFPFIRGLLLFLSALAGSAAQSAGTSAYVPEVLEPWVGWVLEDQWDHDCPFLYSSFADKRCVWPGALALDLDKNSGRFEQDWMVYRSAWITLPGDAKFWPQAVKVDGKFVVVVDRNGSPGVYMAAGEHRVSGEFLWNRRPERLNLGPDTARVDLKLDGRVIDFPQLAQNGQLWLKALASGAASQQDKLTLTVFRRVIDENPLQLITHLQLEVSGAGRETSLKGLMLPDSLPMQLNSPLPARLEPDGALTVQLRPGRWTLELKSRRIKSVESLSLPQFALPWPTEEVWSFDARPALRLVEIEGPASVDPSQTAMPTAWHNLPAFRMTPDARMEFKVKRRGDPAPAPDALSLHRLLWLDFDGKGASFSDRIGGTISERWRLEMQPGLQLGRVALDGQDQLITRIPASERDGVEVRRGNINLQADGRVERSVARLPAIGWAQDMQRLDLEIKLPPGWRALHVQGSDSTPDTWLTQWTLLDLFMVLVLSIAASRLWGWGFGVLMLAMLVLSWHEPSAPRYVWIAILVSLALCKLLPQGWMLKTARWLRNGSWLVLILIAIPFLVSLLRGGFYPQLEQQHYDAPKPATVAMQESMSPAPAVLQDRAMAFSKRARDVSEQLAAAPEAPLILPQQLDEFDPDARVQTGPGLPQWRWNTLNLHWNSPVSSAHELRLWLMSPLATLWIKLLLALLLVIVVAHSFSGKFRLPPAGAAPVLAGALFLPWLIPTPVYADIPDQVMLDDLRARLLAPPDCLPACALSPRMRIEISGDRLTIRQAVHASEAVAIPLPGGMNQWAPDQIRLDGKPAGSLARDTAGRLWAPVAAGARELLLSGPLSQAPRIALDLPLNPKHIDIKADGWAVEGVDAEGLSQGQILLLRLGAQADPDESGAPSGVQIEIPPLLQVERTLILGLEWSVVTRVQRLAPDSGSIIVNIPLLPGEAVLSDGTNVVDGQVRVSFGANQNNWIWRSSLPIQADIQLVASALRHLSETWTLDASPVWHVALAGIPPIHHQSPEGRWLPTWRPWPGETVEIAVSRPKGVTGQTLTIDEARLNVRPGARATASELSLQIRSSQGGQHVIDLPEDSALKSVEINGQAQPIRVDEQGNVSLPITPGAQSVTLSLEQPQGINSHFQTPQLKLGTEAVNLQLSAQMPQNRWLLWTQGPRLGPAVLFWPVLGIIFLLAIVLGRLSITPIRTWQWFLLLVGLSQSPIWVGAGVVGWLLAMGLRCRLPGDIGALRFNLVQLALSLFTIAALLLLFSAIKQGLLGTPDMQIAGNHSNAYDLNWYQDRSDESLPQAAVWSLPLYVYRALMLAWALWLAFALLGFMRWGYECFVSGGVWKKLSRSVDAGARAPRDS